MADTRDAYVRPHTGPAVAALFYLRVVKRKTGRRQRKLEKNSLLKLRSLLAAACGRAARGARKNLNACIVESFCFRPYSSRLISRTTPLL